MLDFDTCLGPAGGGELRLRRLHEADALKVSKGCTLPKTVVWKNSTPPREVTGNCFQLRENSVFNYLLPTVGGETKQLQ